MAASPLPPPLLGARRRAPSRPVRAPRSFCPPPYPCLGRVRVLPAWRLAPRSPRARVAFPCGSRLAVGAPVGLLLLVGTPPSASRASPRGCGSRRSVAFGFGLCTVPAVARGVQPRPPFPARGRFVLLVGFPFSRPPPVRFSPYSSIFLGGHPPSPVKAVAFPSLARPWRADCPCVLRVRSPAPYRCPPACCPRRRASPAAAGCVRLRRPPII